MANWKAQTSLSRADAISLGNQLPKGTVLMLSNCLTNSDWRSSRSKSKFRQLCPKSVSRYQKPPFHLISIILWFNFQCRSRKKFVNYVDLGLTPDIKRSVLKFYGFLIDPFKREDLEAYRDSLSKHVHRLLTALLTGQGPSDRVGNIQLETHTRDIETFVCRTKSKNRRSI